ncbi:hypothetical protein KUTeg_009706 [Tegillarca granosa]|uniref:C-type lectin domain-containing protein n=1 Tax=Tegillarca granosa TaxID=220873 RepID=A0ABQ9F4N3_TEGGR|nr:hypothetical protein KUTeg_009706 [Tegillarca granosa]
MFNRQKEIHLFIKWFQNCLKIKISENYYLRFYVYKKQKQKKKILKSEYNKQKQKKKILKSVKTKAEKVDTKKVLAGRYRHSCGRVLGLEHYREINRTHDVEHKSAINYFYAQSENCLEYGPDSNYKWNDAPCDRHLNVLCEWRILIVYR